MKTISRRLPIVLLAMAAAAAGAKHVTYIRPIMQTLPAAGVTQVVIENLVGPISIQNDPSGQIKLEILVHAGGLDDTFARTLAGQLDFKVEQIGGQLRVTGMYPTDHFRNYGYPYMKSIAFIHGTDSNEYQGQRVYIRAVGSSKAVELWAEVRVTCPSNVGVAIRNIYGDVKVQGDGPASSGSFDGFTDVGDFTMANPRWASVKVESDYGKVDFTTGFGAANDITVKTDYGGAYFELTPGATGQIVAKKDLGFLHNSFTDAKFERNTQGESVMILGDGRGTTVHVDMNVGSLHLSRLPGSQ